MLDVLDLDESERSPRMHCAIWVLMGVASLAGIASEEFQRSGDYGASLRAAKRSQRPLLVVLDRRTMLHWRVNSGVSHEAKDQRKLLEPYQLCHVDVTTEYGKKVASAFGATQFPHLAIIDKTGSVILYERSGGMSNDEWATVLRAHKSGEWKQSQSVVSEGSTAQESIGAGWVAGACFT
jgi:hypothetical protein